jgi:hypothetical protein
MNVEDSYEGALRRLQRLEMAGIAMAPPSPTVTDEPAAGSAERMRELEELAVLACDENERLKHELSVALRETARAQHELGEARYEIDQLRAYVASLQQTLTVAQHAAANAAAQPFAPTAAPPAAALPPASPSTFEPPFASDAWPDEDYGLASKSKGRGAFYFFVIALVGAAIAAVCVLRPWDRPHAVPIVVEPPPAPPPPPVVTAPPPTPKVEATVPQIAPTIPKTAPRTNNVRPEPKHASRRATKKQSSETTKDSAPSMSDDPLGGTGL